MVGEVKGKCQSVVLISPICRNTDTENAKYNDAKVIVAIGCHHSQFMTESCHII